MNESEIKQAIEILKKDRSDLYGQITLLDNVIDRYEAQLLKLQSNRFQIGTAPSASTAEYSDFPTDARVEEQIIYLLERIGHAVRLPDLEAIYKKLVPNGEMYHIARRMRIEGRLVAAKYNNANTKTYYGLPNWVEKGQNGTCYKPEHEPSRNDLPVGRNDFEFL